MQLGQRSASRFTRAELIAQNPILANHEVAVETDSQMAKIGDGVTTYTLLPYIPPGFYSQVATGTDTYAILLTPPIQAYTKGDRYLVQIVNTNTGASTLNVSGLGSAPIIQQDGTAMVAGDLLSGAFYLLVYDGANFQVMAGVGGGGGCAICLTGKTEAELEAIGLADPSTYHIYLDTDNLRACYWNGVEWIYF